MGAHALATRAGEAATAQQTFAAMQATAATMEPPLMRTVWMVAPVPAKLDGVDQTVALTSLANAPTAAVMAPPPIKTEVMAAPAPATKDGVEAVR